jgi:hemerythrin-like domain-containing protein
MNKSSSLPASVIETRVAHNVHRRATTLLAEAAARPSVPAAAVAGLRDFLVPNIRHHHESEDDRLWPMIDAAAPDVALAMAELSGEHNLLDVVLDTLEASDITEEADRETYAHAAASLRDLIHRHLDDEEPVLFPALRDHISDEAWDGFARHVKETSPTVNLHFLIGFIDLVAPPEEVELMLEGLPAPAVEALRAQAQAAFTVLNQGS